MANALTKTLKPITELGKGVGRFVGKHPMFTAMVGGFALLGYVSHGYRKELESREMDQYQNQANALQMQQYAAVSALQGGPQTSCSGISHEGMMAAQPGRMIG